MGDGGCFTGIASLFRLVSGCEPGYAELPPTLYMGLAVLTPLVRIAAHGFIPFPGVCFLGKKNSGNLFDNCISWTLIGRISVSFPLLLLVR